MTETPDLNKTKVFKKGTWNALNALIPEGGHCLPNSITGQRLLWKNAQKNDKKKKISEIMNKAIPQRNPNSTIGVWRPWKTASREISRHHWIIIIQIIIKAIKNKETLLVWNHLANPNVSIKAPPPLIIGQGDSSTRW